MPERDALGPEPHEFLFGVITATDWGMFIGDAVPQFPKKARRCCCYKHRLPRPVELQNLLALQSLRSQCTTSPFR